MERKVLIIDESERDLIILQAELEKYNFVVDLVQNGEDAYKHIKDDNYSLIIVEFALSKTDGLELIKKIRTTSDIPIMVLSAKDDTNSKVMSLDNGADDYLIKPLNKAEFRARVDALLRRYHICETNLLENSVIEIEDMRINTLGRVVNVEDRKINLTAKEFDLLLLLAMNRGDVYSREDLLEKIWGYDEYFADVRTVDVHVRRLRKKIENNPSKPSYIITKWGSGYYFKAE